MRKTLILLILISLGLVAINSNAEICSPISNQNKLKARACSIGANLVRLDVALAASDWKSASPMINPSLDKETFGMAPKKSDARPFSNLCWSIPSQSPQQLGETICFQLNQKQEIQISIEGKGVKNIYGLGEKFLPTKSFKGDWQGLVRTPAIEVGNAMEGFEGGGVANALFSVMYALGTGDRHYALFLDQVAPSRWDFSARPYKIETGKPHLSLYVLKSDSVLQTRKSFMSLVGRPMMPPKRALGFWLSEFGFRSWQEVDDKISTLRKNKFPIDGMVFDAYWYGPVETNGLKNNFGRMEFDPQYFPNAAPNLRRLKAQSHVEVMTHEATYVSQNVPIFNWFTDIGGLIKQCESCASMTLNNYLGPSAFIDFTNAETSAKWHQHKRVPLTELGIRFHWTDFTELDGYGGNDWYEGSGSESHSALDNHNLISLGWARSIAEGYAQSKFSDLRHFTMTRSGIAGIQRYGAALWSGDTGSNFETLGAQINSQVGVELSGVDYFGGDIGGYHRIAIKPDESIDDLYTKWFAHSTVLDVPVRPHTNNWDRKYQTAPDRIGSMDANRQSLRRRYELSPYYYSLSYIAYREGAPLIAPAAIYFSSDMTLREHLETRMIGPWLATVTAPYPGQVERDIYLPRGDWIEYSTLQQVAGGAPLKWNFGNEQTFRLPIFMKRGAIIPMLWVDDYLYNILGDRAHGARITDINATIFPNATESQFSLYEDDGDTNQYLKGSHCVTTLHQVKENGHISIWTDPAVGTYAGAPVERKLVLRIIAEKGAVRAKTVLVNGQPLKEFASALEFEKADSGFMYVNESKLLMRTATLPVGQSVKVVIE